MDLSHKRSLRPLTVAETHSDIEKKKHEVFDAVIERRHGTAMTPPKVEAVKEEMEEYSDGNEEASVGLSRSNTKMSLIHQ